MGESYSSAEMQLVYSTAPVNWAKEAIVNHLLCMLDLTEVIQEKAAEQILFLLLLLMLAILKEASKLLEQ